MNASVRFQLECTDRIFAVVEHAELKITVEEGGKMRTVTAAAGDDLALRFIGEALAAWMRDPRNVLRLRKAVDR